MTSSSSPGLLRQPSDPPPTLSPSLYSVGRFAQVSALLETQEQRRTGSSIIKSRLFHAFPSPVTLTSSPSFCHVSRLLRMPLPLPGMSFPVAPPDFLGKYHCSHKPNQKVSFSPPLSFPAPTGEAFTFTVTPLHHAHAPVMVLDTQNRNHLPN